METALTALIIIAIVLFGLVTLAHGYLAAQDSIQEAWQAMEARASQRARTRLSAIAAIVLDTGATIEITLRNDGSERLADLARWDVVLQYSAPSGPVARWYPYTGMPEPSVNQWTTRGIYLDAAQAIPEAYDPQILNPGEEMVIRIRVSPPVADATTSLATIATVNGVSTSLSFSK